MGQKDLRGGDALEKTRNLLKNFRGCMMTTESTGDIHTRPMWLQGKPEDFDGTLWFFADNQSHKMGEVTGGRLVSLIFQSDNDSAYLQLIGVCHQIDDHARMKELYTPLIKTWFPKGLDDPRLTLLRFDASHGHFWDSPGGMLQVLAAFTKSIVTGDSGRGGESGDLSLSKKTPITRSSSAA
jgi:general stress protein 26